MQYTVSQPATGVATPRQRPSLRLGWLARFAEHKSGLVGLCILLPIVLLAVASPYLPLADPIKPNVIASLHSPSPAHPFGTDKLGREILSRTISGLRVSLTVGFFAAGISLCVGIVIGTLAGFMGKAVDAVISAIVDVFLAFPSLLLAIGIIAVFGPGMPQVIAALATAGTPSAIRLQRALTLSLKSRTYMDAARMASAPSWWMLVRHVIPNTLAPMVVFASIQAANAILAEAGLSYLGLGILPPQPSLGNLVSDGRPYLQNAWWISTIPGLAIALVSISLHLLSDGIREHLDPRLGV